MALVIAGYSVITHPHGFPEDSSPSPSASAHHHKKRHPAHESNPPGPSAPASGGEPGGYSSAFCVDDPAKPDKVSSQHLDPVAAQERFPANYREFCGPIFEARGNLATFFPHPESAEVYACIATPRHLRLRVTADDATVPGVGEDGVKSLTFDAKSTVQCKRAQISLQEGHGINALSIVQQGGRDDGVRLDRVENPHWLNKTYVIPRWLDPATPSNLMDLMGGKAKQIAGG